MKKPAVLLIDDEEAILAGISYVLEKNGYRVVTANGGEQGLEVFKKENLQMVITDLVMDGIGGLEVLKQVKEIEPETMVVIMTGHGEMDSSIEALRLGASDYLLKPCKEEELLFRVTRCFEKLQMLNDAKKTNEKLKKSVIKHQELEKSLRASNKQLELLSTLDGLTGIANRRTFEKFLEREWKSSMRHTQPATAIMMDIDFFKLYNDTYGHQAGDDCLKKVARTIEKSLRRPGDLVARYGGEEFVAILSDTSQKGAFSLAEKVRASVEALEIPHQASPVNKFVTISLGVASRVPERGDASSILISEADQSLYKAKQEGRNRVME
ncbi:MAG: diguanylate cyclase [Nitrospina sp.]|nr:diguanylate cyclase [Nitrospina sp.]MBT4104001.1 diguanylate cyclase [Nitrospina sp.]MBT4389741.1 diguanylate cyclase [Nitrospina sp.]MBT4621833.1 diguanylate cyclase [Nitrospina sp.]MBT4897746.1 diguanylate cyclase [Nitrospina sp.]